MKTRESGMPPEEKWQEFFDAQAILGNLGLRHDCNGLLEFGCGFGTFTIPAAKIIKGIVYALDIDPAMIAATKAKVEVDGLKNVELLQRDFIVDGSGLPDCSVDYVMLFNILHADERMQMLKEAWRVLVPGGTLAVIHWNYDATTPRGPSMGIRPRPEQCRSWAEKVGFVISIKGLIELPPYHYGFAFSRPSS